VAIFASSRPLVPNNSVPKLSTNKKDISNRTREIYCYTLNLPTLLTQTSLTGIYKLKCKLFVPKVIYSKYWLAGKFTSKSMFYIVVFVLSRFNISLTIKNHIFPNFFNQTKINQPPV
jgi:hypothetical protein